MKTTELLNHTNVSLYKNTVDRQVWKEVTLLEWLISLSYSYNVKQVGTLRHKFEYKSDAYNRFKTHRIGAVTISATFQGVRDSMHLKTNNHLMVIDIDYKDNQDKTVDELKRISASFPFSAVTMMSVSGKGIFTIIPYKEGLNHKKVFNAIKDYYTQHDITIDAQCNDIPRLRVNSYDENILIRDEVEVWDKEAEDPSKTTATTTTKTDYGEFTKTDAKLLAFTINDLIIEYGYGSYNYPHGAWIMDAYRLSALPTKEGQPIQETLGYKLFLYLSRATEGYKGDDDVLHYYTAVITTTRAKGDIPDISAIGWFFNQLKKHVGDNWQKYIKDKYEVE